MSITHLQAIRQYIIKNCIKPLFKEAGFTIKNTTFYKSLEYCLLIVDIQSSRYNDADKVRFTLNYGFYSQELYEIWYNSAPKQPKASYGFYNGRIGEFLPNETDWYEITQQTNPEELLSVINQDIQEYFLPALQRFSSLDSLLQFTDVKDNGILAHLFLLKKSGQWEKAKNREDALLKQIEDASLNKECLIKECQQLDTTLQNNPQVQMKINALRNSIKDTENIIFNNQNVLRWSGKIILPNNNECLKAKKSVN